MPKEDKPIAERIADATFEAAFNMLAAVAEDETEAGILDSLGVRAGILWRCHECEEANLGSEEKCVRCGTPKE
jgi:hypothetical protein